MRKTSILFYLLLVPAFTNAQWLKLELDAPGGVYSLWNSGDTLFAGHDSVFYYSFDSGENWERSARFPDVEYGITAIFPHNGVIYAGTSGQGVFRSFNSGDTWEQFSQGLNEPGANEISGLAIRNDTLYASTIGAGVYRRPLTGSGVWSAFNEGLPFSTSWNVNTIVNLDGDIYAGAGANSYLAVNRKNTGYWQELQFDQFNGEMNGVLSFAESNGKIIASAHQAVYTSVDNGLSWTKHAFGIGLASTSSIIARGGVIVVAISKAARYYIYYSSDNGVTWWRNDMQSGVVAYSLALAGGKIWCGRMDGLYYKPDTITSIGDGENEPATSKQASIALYPNPVTRNAQLSVEFSGIDAGHASIELFNAMGEKVKPSLFNYNFKSEGLIDLETAGLAPGVYIVRLSSSEKSATGKFLLIP